MRGEQLVIFATNDLSGVTRGRAVPRVDTPLTTRLRPFCRACTSFWSVAESASVSRGEIPMASADR